MGAAALGLLLVSVGTAAPASADVALPVLNTTSWSDTYGYTHIVGEVQNTSPSSVTFVRVNFDLFDGVGTLIGTDFTYTRIDTLAPGEKSPFQDAFTTPPGYASYNITSVTASVATVPANHNFTTTRTSTYIDSIGAEHFVGTVTNNNVTTSAYVDVSFTFRDASGNVVGTDFTYVNTTDASLAPGQTASFEEIRLGGPAYSQVDLMSQSSTPPTYPDTTAPAASLTAPTATFATTQRPVVSWTASDAGSGVATSTLRYSRGLVGSGAMSAWVMPSPWAALTGRSVTVSAALGYRYCFQVRATDRSGNVGAWSAARCTNIGVDDRALAATTGWTRATATGWLASTATVTKAKGKSLWTPKSQRVRQVGVIATRCAACGVIAIYVGSTRVGTISLYKSATVSRALLLLPRFTTTRSGVVRLVTTSYNKTVKIDALSVTAW